MPLSRKSHQSGSAQSQDKAAADFPLPPDILYRQSPGDLYFPIMWLLTGTSRDALLAWKVTAHLADGVHSEKEKYWE